MSTSDETPPPGNSLLSSLKAFVSFLLVLALGAPLGGAVAISGTEVYSRLHGDFQPPDGLTRVSGTYRGFEVAEPAPGSGPSAPAFVLLVETPGPPARTHRVELARMGARFDELRRPELEARHPPGGPAHLAISSEDPDIVELLAVPRGDEYPLAVHVLVVLLGIPAICFLLTLLARNSMDDLVEILAQEGRLEGLPRRLTLMALACLGLLGYAWTADAPLRTRRSWPVVEARVRGFEVTERARDGRDPRLGLRVTFEFEYRGETRTQAFDWDAPSGKPTPELRERAHARGEKYQARGSWRIHVDPSPPHEAWIRDPDDPRHPPLAYLAFWIGLAGLLLLPTWIPAAREARRRRAARRDPDGEPTSGN